MAPCNNQLCLRWLGNSSNPKTPFGNSDEAHNMTEHMQLGAYPEEFQAPLASQARERCVPLLIGAIRVFENRDSS